MDSVKFGYFIAYNISHVGKSLLWTASDLLTLYELISIYRIDPMLAAGIYLLGLGVNAIADFAVGMWLDARPEHSVRITASALLISALVFPATMLLAPSGTGAVVAATLVFRVAYAGLDVPHNALMSRLASCPAQAISLARGRTIGTSLASFAVALIAGGLTRTANMPAWLWSFSGVALIAGAAVLPILRTMGIQSPSAKDGRASLPIAFLAASVLGIMALGTLAKSLLHLPVSGESYEGSTILVMLTVGKALSALVPLRLTSPRGGLILLSLAYIGAGIVAGLFANGVSAAIIVGIGFFMGFTNLIGWSLLPALATGARSYGLYTMVSKLALGGTGLALAGGLGREPSFTPDSLITFVIGVAVTCIAAAALASPFLTLPFDRSFSQP